MSAEGADSVIFYDMDWNPAMCVRCVDRLSLYSLSANTLCVTGTPRLKIARTALARREKVTLSLVLGLRLRL